MSQTPPSWFRVQVTRLYGTAAGSPIKFIVLGAASVLAGTFSFESMRMFSSNKLSLSPIPTVKCWAGIPGAVLAGGGLFYFRTRRILPSVYQSPQRMLRALHARGAISDSDLRKALYNGIKDKTFRAAKARITMRRVVYGVMTTLSCTAAAGAGHSFGRYLICGDTDDIDSFQLAVQKYRIRSEAREYGIDLPELDELPALGDSEDAISADEYRERILVEQRDFRRRHVRALRRYAHRIHGDKKDGGFEFTDDRDDDDREASDN